MKTLSIRLLPAKFFVVGGLMLLLTIFFLFPAHAKALDDSSTDGSDSSACSSTDTTDSTDSCSSSSDPSDSDSSDSADTATTDQSDDGTGSSSTDTSTGTGSDQSDSSGTADSDSGDDGQTDTSGSTDSGTDTSSDPTSDGTTSDGTTSDDSGTTSSDGSDDSCPTPSSDDTNTSDSGDSSDSGTTDSGSTDTSGDDSSGSDSTADTGTDGSPSDGSDSDDTTGDTTDLSADNCDDSTATSGSSTVTDNSDGGDATSGDASDVLTLINELSAMTGLSPDQLSSFIINIMGNQSGNVEITPAMIEAGLADAEDSGDGSTVVNTDGSINNNDNLTADSGDASVTDNGVGGSATSGNADVVANIINIINSIIADQQAFVGTINIYGNLDGDILLPQQLVDELLSLPGSTDESGSLSSADTQQIVNNITENSSTGAADDSNNGVGGSATSGNASNGLSLSNLVDYQLTGSNLLLVIINVMGNWYGVILNGVGGTNTAFLSGGDGSAAQTSSDPSVDSNSNESIVNNLNLNAQSGDATVENNWYGGNATSGNASTMANIINIADDQFNLSGWFGILFINVFGTWDGNLSTYNDAPAVDTTDLNPTNSGGQSSPTTPINSSVYLTSYYWNPGDGTSDTSSGNALTAATNPTLTNSVSPTMKPGYLEPQKSGLDLALIVLVLIPGVSLIVLERFLNYRQKHSKAANK